MSGIVKLHVPPFAPTSPRSLAALRRPLVQEEASHCASHCRPCAQCEAQRQAEIEAAKKLSADLGDNFQSLIFDVTDSNAIKEMEPNIAPVYYKGILFEGSRHTTNPLKISQKILETFIDRGGVFLNKKVTSIDGNNNKINLRCESSSQEYDNIIICAGAWSKQLALMVGDNFPLDTERGYHVLFENTEKLIDRPIGWSQFGFYIIQIEEGIRSAGTVEIAGLNNRPNQKRLRMIEQETRKLLPTLDKVKSTWLGFRPTLPDAMPVIGPSKKNKKVFYAFGHQHIGWTLAAVTGKSIQYMINGNKPNFDLSAFNPNRFH